MEPVTVEKVCRAITRIYNFVNEKKDEGEKMNISRRGWQENLVLVGDAVVITFSYIAAYFLRFDGVPDAQYMDMMVSTLPFLLIIRMAALFYFKLNTSMWQYASVKDLVQIIKAVTVSSVVIVAVTMVIHAGYPRSVFIIDWLLLVIALSGTRFTVRLTRPLRTRQKNGNGRRKRVLIVGAGDAGEMIARDMVYRYSYNYEVVGFIDDAQNKQRKQIHGVPILGEAGDIPAIVKKRNIEEIIIAIPSATSDERRGILDYCIKSGAKYRTVPHMSDLIDGTVKVKELREVRLEDLIGRDDILPDKHKIAEYIKGKSVLITGAGGSIGSELCRQVAGLNPGKLILFEKAENPLFYIDMELGRSFEGLRKISLVGDICDKNRVEDVFSEHKPHIVFHAAAHKHVPLMEINGMEAIKNNVFGTKILAEAAAKSGVEKFIMLSTDKAVEPTSIMGVSKSVAELYIMSLWDMSATKFMAVRFGNVLGSEGSVVPAFKKMIEKGGPITITHPDITRYFMTIPEAAALVMEAGYMGHGGEIFILEMGKQIKILDLAYDMIKLSGLAPDTDIEIVFTGLRPGEKMYEALVTEDEELLKTPHEKIMVLKSNKERGTNIISCLDVLKQIVTREDSYLLFEQLKKMVPSYKPFMQIPHKTTLPEERKISNKKIDILIADDERIVQEVLSKFLDGRGYNTLLASNGREAMNIVNTNEVRLAFIDIRMPGFADGLQTLKRIKKTNKNIEVIMMTGYGTEKARRESSLLGAYAYLEKPFDLSDIRSKVESALHKEECLA
ncbi:MAG: polysaccharide biosynthesis protein [Candidatus Omnitrophica bacterium]|nr:polysaccharide biosynthesis protein [Candidatus Omnitrophota bacterium]